jgi:KipI family sensor histidine kinase inhibitor
VPARIQTYGPKALLASFDIEPSDLSLARLRRLGQILEDRQLPGMTGVSFGYATLLVEFESPEYVGEAGTRLGSLIESAASDPPPLPESRVVDIPVHYAGPDLDRVARHTGLSARQIAELHSHPLYRVHFLGFAPGFAYITGMDPELATPRLEKPRPRVEPGSVGIGGAHTGVYSTATSGGWNLIGNTSLPLFTPDAKRVEEMFLLKPMDKIKFVESESEIDAARANSPSMTRSGSPILKLVRRGAGASVQDGGRPGWKQYGVPPGGAMDRQAMTLANLLVGNASDAPVLEMCLGGQKLKALRSGHVGLAGADLGFILRTSGPEAARPVPVWRSTWVEKGDVVESTGRRAGVWAYLAVPSGFAAPSHFGSVGADPRSGLGGIVHEGELLYSPCAEVPAWREAIQRTRIRKAACLDYASSVSLRVWPGPQIDWFGNTERERFFSTSWQISIQSDRAGYRLEGNKMQIDLRQLISEPNLVGSIQIPPSGEPIITLNDGPTIGGYPKLGLVDERDLPFLVQTAPGTSIQFRPAEAF